MDNLLTMKGLRADTFFWKYNVILNVRNGFAA